MPPKIRQLKADLARAGFIERPAKGSHTFWTHPALPGCMTHGKTYEEAVQQGKEAIEGWIDVAKALGWPIPAPNAKSRLAFSLRSSHTVSSGQFKSVVDNGNSPRNVAAHLGTPQPT